MTTIRRLIYGQILTAVAFVTLGFVALFLFFDLMEEFKQIGSNGYKTIHALIFVGLLVPGRLYEMMPITVLIGSIFVLTRFAQTSEFTILRTSGLSPLLALRTLLWLGLGFVVLTFAIGDYVAPAASQRSDLFKARFLNHISNGRSGIWLKETQQDKRYAVNVRLLNTDRTLSLIRIFEFDKNGAVLSLTHAEKAVVNKGEWALENVTRSVYPTPDNTNVMQTLVKSSTVPMLKWPTSLTTGMVAVAVLTPGNMSTAELYRYIGHLDANGQASQVFEIAFWRKVFYPFSCLVMLVLALPFAYLHFRTSGISGYVFIGVMTGISFFLLNNVFGYLGDLQHWWPWLASAAPSLIYTALSLAAFSWLVIRR